MKWLFQWTALVMLSASALAQYDLPCGVGPIAIRAYTLVSSASNIVVWPTNDLRTEIRVGRRVYTNNPNYWNTWTWLYTNKDQATVKQASQYADTNIVGTSFEYVIATLATNWNCVLDAQFQNGVNYTNGAGYTNRPAWAYQYINTGYQVPIKDDRGKLILLVESGVASAIATELATLTNDLIGDGYRVYRHDVAAQEVVTNGGANTIWYNAVTNTKALVVADYNTDPTANWTIFIVGHVPIPYSGLTSPGSHLDNFGAHPADWFYAVTNSALWTDTTANDTTASYPSDWNIPGDGRFDQNVVPGVPQMWLGRVDLTNMIAFGKTYAQQLQQYLNRDHAWRQAQTVVRDRGLVITNGFPFQVYGKWSSLFGNGTSYDLGQWLKEGTNSASPYLFAASAGAGGFDHDITIGTTTNFANAPFYAVFVTSMGSYYGDWDSGQHSNDFCQAAIADAGLALTMTYGENTINMDSTSMGEPIGNETYAMAANVFISPGDFSKRYIQSGYVVSGTEYLTIETSKNYTSLMGDPTLRVRVVAPPTNTLQQVDGGDRVIYWIGSTDTNIQGYHVYRAPATNLNMWTRLTTPPTNSPYRDASVPTGTNYTYWVRAVKLEQSTNRSYYNPSEAAFSSGVHTNYYVATNGNNSNPGTSASPFLTVQKGVSVAAAGDMIFLGQGAYAEKVTSARSGTAGSPIVVDGQGVATVNQFFLSHQYQTLQNMTIVASNQNWGVFLAKGAHLCVISNNVFDFQSDSNRWIGIRWDTPNPDLPFGINVASGCLVVSNLFTHLAGTQAIFMYGDTNTIYGNTFRDNDAIDCVYFWGRSNHIVANYVTNLYDSETVGNHPDIFQSFGANGQGATDILIESNYVFNTGQDVQIFMLEGQDCANCFTNIVFRNNVFAHMWQPGYVAYPNVSFYNNTFVDCATNVELVIVVTSAEWSGSVEGVGPYTNRNASVGDNCHIFNNVFFECGKGRSVGGWYIFSLDLSNVLADFNFVCRTNYLPFDTNTLHQPIGNPTGWNKFAWWENHGINGGNPGFVNNATDFHVTTNSFLYLAGTNLSSLFTKDIAGTTRPASGGWTIGAYEVNAGANPPAPPTPNTFSAGTIRAGRVSKP